MKRTLTSLIALSGLLACSVALAEDQPQSTKTTQHNQTKKARHKSSTKASNKNASTVAPPGTNGFPPVPLPSPGNRNPADPQKPPVKPKPVPVAPPDPTAPTTSGGSQH